MTLKVSDNQYGCRQLTTAELLVIEFIHRHIH